MAKNKTLELSIRIAGKVDKSLTAAINQSSSMLGSLTATMSKAGTVGLAAMGAMTAATVAGLVKCTGAAREFEASMGDVVKYVDGLADRSGKISGALAGNGKSYAQNYADMTDAILELSTQIPMTAEELTRLAAAAGQSGKSISDLIQYDGAGNISGFLKDVAMMGTAMDISAEQAGDWAAKWEKAFGIDHDQVMVLSDQINYLGANSATTAAEIAEVVNETAGLGQVAGMDVSSTAALADAMLAMGVDTGKAANAISRMYVNLSKGASATKAQKSQWEALGFTAEGVAKAMQTNATGTIIDVFEAIQNLDADKQVAALNTLFGQWAIKGAAKLTGNLGTLTDALAMANDPSLYGGSMEREFIIKASNSEAIDTMMSNAFQALKIDVGTAFLPAKKEMSVALIGFINQLRDMPELGEVAQTLAAIFSQGVQWAGEALQAALPYMQQGLNYLLDHGPQVISVLKNLVIAFTAMKFAPGITGLLGGAGNLLLGTAADGGGRRGGLLNGVAGLFYGGQRIGGLAANVAGEAGRNGLWTSLVAAKNTFFNTRGKGLADGAGGLLRYWNGVRSSAGAFGRSLGLDRAGGFLVGAFKDIFSILGSSIAGTPQAQAVLGAGSFLKNGAMGLAGRAGGVVRGIAASGFGQAVGRAGGVIGSLAGSAAGPAGRILSSGAGLLGSIWKTPLSIFGSLFSGAVPVVGAVSSIIAVVSILGDHLEDIRGIVGSVFGPQGLAVFDAFTGKLEKLGGFISSLFVDGGVAQALAGVRENIVGSFGPEAGAAFDGLVQILQSVMGVAGQVVSFASTTVKPILQDIFAFLSRTAVPMLLQAFSSAAPYIAGIISGLGSAVMAGMQVIGSGIQAVLPLAKGIVSVILGVGSVAIPALLAGISVFSQGAATVLGAVRTVFDGLLKFVKGVFTLNWRQAWQGVLDVFGGVFQGLGALIKTPLNAVIAIVNKAISGINGLGLDIPDWVPLIGGRKFAISLPELPMLAGGGFTNGASIAGEAGREAVISFRSGVRARNIETWVQAGRLLGVSAQQAAGAAGLRALMDTGNSVELKEPARDGGNGGEDGWNISYAPQIIIQGSADRETVDEALREAQARFEAWFEEMMRRRKRLAY